MPRQAGLDPPGTLHRVMICGINGANIFGDHKDRECFLSRVGEIMKAPGTRSLASPPHRQQPSLARKSEEEGVEGGGRNGLLFGTRGRSLNG
mgnify:CR=1 FL=1